MMDIARARQSARSTECDRDPDRGSDIGDVSEIDVCASDTEEMCTAPDIEELHPPACLYSLNDGLTCGASP